MTDLASKDFYARLEVSKEVESEAVIKAYRKLSRKYHPDKGGNEKDFQALGEAHECLKDPFQRSMYDTWLAGDQKEPFNTNGIPDLSEMWPEGSWWQPIVCAKRIGLLLVLALLFGGLAVYTVALDWWAWFNSQLEELKRYITASLPDDHAWKQSSTEDSDIIGEVFQAIFMISIVGWYAGCCCLWEDSPAVAGEAGAAGGSALATGQGENVSSWLPSLPDLISWSIWAAPATASAEADLVSRLFKQVGKAAAKEPVDVAALGLDEEEAAFLGETLVGELQPEQQQSVDAEVKAQGALCGPGTVWDGATGFCVVDEASVAAAAAAAAETANVGWFWWLNWLSPPAWAYSLLSYATPVAVMVWIDWVGVLVGVLVKYIYALVCIVTAFQRAELNATMPELSKGERAVWWDTVAVCLAFAYFFAYESSGMFWALCWSFSYPYLLDCTVTKAVPFLDEKLDNVVTNTWQWYTSRWKEEPAITLLLSAVLLVVWSYSGNFYVRCAVGLGLLLPLYGVISARASAGDEKKDSNSFLEFGVVFMFGVLYCVFVWGLIWSSIGCLVCGWLGLGLQQVPQIYRDFTAKKAAEEAGSPKASSPKAGE